MTTKVHIVNFGPEIVIVQKRNPTTRHPQDAVIPAEQVLWPQQSLDLYVHSEQSLDITEKVPDKRT